MNLKEAFFLSLSLIIASAFPQSTFVINPSTTIGPNGTTQIPQISKTTNVTAVPDSHLLNNTQKPNGSFAEIYSFHVRSNIKYRYAMTKVTSKVANRNELNSTEVNFSFLLPKSAFISKFAMSVDDKYYTAIVKPKEEAKMDYIKSVNESKTAGLIEKDLTQPNVFTLSVNVRAGGYITFYLKYEELLHRNLGKYEHAINFFPIMTQVKDFVVEVNIDECQELSKIFVKENLKNKKHEIIQIENLTLKPQLEIQRPNNKSAQFIWKPTPTGQLQMTNETIKEFVVEYIVAKVKNEGEILVRNGYFVHFFAPPFIKSLIKHVVFVLDLSGSMERLKLVQLKSAMGKILSELKTDDYFNIILFDTEVVNWHLEEKAEIVSKMKNNNKNKNKELKPYQANADNINKAQKFVSSLVEHGWTNINEALLTAIKLTSTFKAGGIVRTRTRQPKLPKDVDSMIIFLTDGDPTHGVTNMTKIQDNVRNANKDKVSIYSLAFGADADYNFLKKISLQNSGFAREIYENAAADLQIAGFYKEISSPLLKNVKFNYTSFGYEVEDLSNTEFPTVFDGSEIVVAGILNDDMDTNNTQSKYNNTIQAFIGGKGRNGNLNLNQSDYQTSENVNQTVKSRDNFIERLYAYQTIHQLLDQDFANLSTKNSFSDFGPNRARITNRTRREEALRLALDYGFVTPLTSLVIKDVVSMYADLKNYTKHIIELPSREPPKRPLKNTDNEIPGSTQFGLMSLQVTFDDEEDDQNSTTPKPFEQLNTDDYDYGSDKEKFVNYYSLFSQIPWLKSASKNESNYQYLDFNGTHAEIAELNEGIDADVGFECQNGEIFGVCKHLKDCVISEIKSNLVGNDTIHISSLYFSSYACLLKTRELKTNKTYVGICCPEM